MATLSDGTSIMVVMDANETGQGAGFGDGTQVPKMFLYASSTVSGLRTGYALKTSYATQGGTANGNAFYFAGTYAIAVDASNNIHAVYYNMTNNRVEYVKFTWAAGNAYSATVITTIVTYGASISVRQLDIDCIGTGTDNPVISIYREDGSASPVVNRVSVYVKNNSAAWVNTANITGASWVGSFSYSSNGAYCMATLAASQEASPDATGYHYFAIAVSNPNPAQTGASIYSYQVNLTTGAAVSSTTVFNATLQLNNSGNGRMFYRGAKEWVWVGWKDTSGFWSVGGFKLDTAGTTATITYNSPSLFVTTGPVYADTNLYSAPYAITYIKATNRVLINYTTNGNAALYSVIRLGAGTDTSVLAGSNGGYWLDSWAVPSGQTGFQNHLVMWTASPQTRNVTTTYVDTMMAVSYYSSTSARWNLYWYMVQKRPIVSVGPTPSPYSGAVSTSRPNVKGQYKWDTLYPQMSHKTQFQFATDTGFTTNLRDYLEEDQYLVNLYNAISTWGDGTAHMLPSLYALYQTTWYIRSRQISELGEIGAWSPFLYSFGVSHPPTPTNISPSSSSSGQIINYGAGGVNVSWTFSDPYPWDYQTYHLVEIYRVSDGLTVSSYAYTAGSVNSTFMPVSAIYKDVLLAVRVSVKDMDGVASGYYYGGAFYLSDPPVLAITSPTAGTITTGIPTVSWTLSKTQSAYRVLVTNGSTVAWDTGWTAGAVGTRVVPAGSLVTGRSYTVTVYSRDVLNVEVSQSVIVTTAFTPPAVPSAGTVSLAEYRDRGYINIFLDPSGFDADFVSFNLYRRKYGETTYTLIKQFYNPNEPMIYQDFQTAPNSTYEYSATQLVNRFGDILESIKKVIRTVTPIAETYWLVDPVNSLNSMPLYNTTDEQYTDEYEEAEYNIIGRGRHKEYGDRLGNNGTLVTKMRDKFISGIAKVNYAINPSMCTRDSDAAGPTGYVIAGSGTTGTISNDFYNSTEVLPTLRSETVRITAAAMGTATTDYIQISRAYTLAEIPPVVTGDSITVSCWAWTPPVAVNYNIVIVAYNAANAVLGTYGDLVTLTPQEYYYDPSVSTSPDYGIGMTGQKLGRYKTTFTVPASFDHYTVYFRMRGTGAGTAGLQKSLIVTGWQIETGATMTRYFDGNTFGATWRAGSELGFSETTGYYTARQQRQEIMVLKAQKSELILRNPFGDTFQVAPGNIAVTRIPGVGANEFVDVSMPYSEVAF
jgi:hypothetical protein